MTLVEQIVGIRRNFHRLLTRRLGERSFQAIRLLRHVTIGRAKTQAELADRMVMDAAAVCRLVDRLEAEGLVVRCKGDDRRSIRLEATEAASPHVAQLDKQLALLHEQACSLLTPEEVETLQRLLEKVQTALCAVPE